MAKRMIYVPEPIRGTPTGEQTIRPGEYAINDKKLFGLGEWLVENDMASLVNPLAQVIATGAPPITEVGFESEPEVEGETPEVNETFEDDLFDMPEPEVENMPEARKGKVKTTR